tara:strand:- start:6888 stop:7148 length:261 start_codon:yes stop_codon:yes gene_type:complete
MGRLLDGIVNYYVDEEILTADGFDNAVIGIDDKTMRVIYSVTKCIEILMTEMGMGMEEAVEFFEFNVKGSELGEKTPIWCEDMLIE